MTDYTSDAYEIEAPTKSFLEPTFQTESAPKPRGKALSDYYDGDSDGSEAEAQAGNARGQTPVSNARKSKTNSRERTPASVGVSLDRKHEHERGFESNDEVSGSVSKLSSHQATRGSVSQMKGIVSESFALPPNQQKVSPKKVFPPIASASERSNDQSNSTDSTVKESHIPRAGLQRRRPPQGNTRVPGLPKPSRKGNDVRPPILSDRSERSDEDTAPVESTAHKQKTRAKLDAQEAEDDSSAENGRNKIIEKKPQDKAPTKKTVSSNYSGGSDVESVIAEKNRMIEQLKVEIRTLETVNRRYERDFIALSERQDSMPKQIGGFQYEIRALKDRLRASQERVAVSERTIQNQEDYIIKLKAHCTKLENILKSKNLSENMIEDDERLRRQIEEKENANKELRNQIRLLQEARDSDYKRHKSLLKAAQSETAQIRKEMERLVQLTTERDNELKANNIKLEREMNRKRKELQEAQKLIQAQQIQSQNAQIIPPNVPHGTTPPAPAPVTIVKERSVRDESPSRQQPNGSNQKPPRSKIPAPSKSPVKTFEIQRPKNEPTSEVRGPSEPTEELSGIPEKALSKIPSSRKTRSKAEQQNRTTARKQSPEKQTVVTQQIATTKETDEQTTNGMTSYPSISSIPISSLAKQAHDSATLLAADAPKEDDIQLSLEVVNEKGDTKQDLVGHESTDANELKAEEEPNTKATIEPMNHEIDDSVLYDSENERETSLHVHNVQKMEPVSEVDFEVAEENDMQPISSVQETDVNVETVKEEESEELVELVDDEPAQVVALESEFPSEDVGDGDIPEYSNDFQPDNELEGVNPIEELPPQTNIQADTHYPIGEITEPTSGNFLHQQAQQSVDQPQLFRAENIGEPGVDFDGDDLPDIVNQQNRIVDEARWNMNHDDNHLETENLDSYPVEGKNAGLFEIEDGSAELPKSRESPQSHPPLIAQDSVLKPEFGRAKKKYD